jgi:hypothetical protein
MPKIGRLQGRDSLATKKLKISVQRPQSKEQGRNKSKKSKLWIF